MPSLLGTFGKGDISNPTTRYRTPAEIEALAQRAGNKGRFFSQGLADYIRANAGSAPMTVPGRAGFSPNAQATMGSMFGANTQAGGIGSDMAQRGMTGSPFASSLYGGVASSAQRRSDEALSRFYQAAMSGASDQALMSQRATMAAVGGVPQPQFSPGAAGAASEAAGTALSLYLMSL